jgi:hypothetical protein
MLDTGFPRADAENDFLRARRRHVLATLAHRLRRQPPGSDHLLRLDDVTGALGWRGEGQLGLQAIRLDTIVGTASSGRDFDRHFRPDVTEILTAVPPAGTMRLGRPDVTYSGRLC